MAQILLAAASGLARETLESIRQTGDHEVIGILDDNTVLHGSEISGIPVLGGLEMAVDREEQLLLCVGKSRARAAVAERLALPDSRYAKHIHPSTLLGSNTKVGAGSIILAGSVATTDVTIGRHAVLMPHVLLTHDDVLGDYCTLAGGATVAGGVHIGHRSYVGTSASIKENVKLGADSVLGMGSVLLEDIPAGETWVGNPAHKLFGPTNSPSDTAPQSLHA